MLTCVHRNCTDRLVGPTFPQGVQLPQYRTGPAGPSLPSAGRVEQSSPKPATKAAQTPGLKVEYAEVGIPPLLRSSKSSPWAHVPSYGNIRSLAAPKTAGKPAARTVDQQRNSLLRCGPWNPLHSLTTAPSRHAVEAQHCVQTTLNTVQDYTPGPQMLQ
jgi:hypothetical protein